MSRARCLGFCTLVHRRRSASTRRTRGSCDRPGRGGRCRCRTSQPRVLVEKHLSPAATWVQELQARRRSTNRWGREGRICSGLRWAGAHWENVATPVTAATEASWVFGASRCNGMSRIICARSGVMVAPWHARGIRTLTPTVGVETEPLYRTTWTCQRRQMALETRRSCRQGGFAMGE